MKEKTEDVRSPLSCVFTVSIFHSGTFKVWQDIENLQP